MAYKFQVGDAILSGALAQEGDVDIIDGGFLKMGGSNIITAAGAVANITTVTATGKIVGNEFATDGNEFLVSTAGQVTAVGVVAGGAISAATTIAASGKITGNEFATDGNEFLVSTAGQVTAVGVVAGGAISAVTSISGSGLSTAGSLASGQGGFTVSTLGVMVAGATTLASLNNSGGGITNAGVVSGSVIDGTVLAGTELVSQGPISGSGLVSGLKGFNGASGRFTVSTAGAVKAASLNNSAGGITNAGPIAGGTTLALSGLASVASISMDDGSTLGPDSVADLWTLSADGDTTQKDGTYDFVLASHDGTNGLKLGTTLVTATAANLNATTGFAGAVYARAADSIVFLDADTGALRSEGNDDFLNAIAGAGLSVVGNQLEADAGSITPSEFKPGDAGLGEGFNYATGSADSFTATLPAVIAADYGTMVRIKAGPLAAGKAITIQGSPSTPLHKIDGGTQVILESPYAAITCVYATSGSWYVL